MSANKETCLNSVSEYASSCVVCSVRFMCRMDNESVADSGFVDLSELEHLAEASTVINPELHDQSVVDAHLYNDEPDVANLADFDDEDMSEDEDVSEDE